MGGEISVVSEPGAGAAFSFFVVVDRAPARAAAEHRDLKGRRVLTVQENPRGREILVRLLDASTMAVQSFAAPAEALAEYRPGSADLVIADLRMNGMTGLALVHELRRRDPQPPPVILLAPLESRETCDARDATIIRKPIRPTHLLQTIEFLLGSEGRIVRSEADGEESRPDFGELSVLVAEDNPVNQQVVRQMLDKLGVKADIVGDGQEAVDAMNRGAYDLVLMDLQMPRKDGFTAAREIRAAWGHGAYIAAMTANALEVDRAACRDAGMDDFIPKPVRVDDLEHRLRTVLARTQRSSVSA
jgi:CheY-like chemotaxis protein